MDERETPFPLPRRDDGRLKWLAFSAAVLLHVIALAVRFPEPAVPEPERHRGPAIVVRRYVPPPPPIVTQPRVRRAQSRRLPVPDPTPQEPEPVQEPDSPIPPDSALPGEVELLVGAPEGPPVSGIALAGSGGVTLPELIPETKQEPEYPEAARIARAKGSVILQAVITREGTVGELELLRCDPPFLGFEEAAIAAVREWRYRPATSNGKPVDAYFTVFVSFDLL